TIAEMLMPSWLARLRAEHDDLSATLKITNSVTVEALVVGREVRLGFVEGPDIGPDVDHQVIADDELVVVVARSHRWSSRSEPLSPDELVREPLVLREHGSGTRHALERALARAGVGEPRIALELGSTASVLRAVADGAGPTVVSRLAAAPALTTTAL